MRYNKFGNKKIKQDNHIFDSKKESARYSELKILEKAKVIKDLIIQPRYILQEGYVICENCGIGDCKNRKHIKKKAQKIEYIADFEYYDCETNQLVVEDVKGFKTDIYKLKKKLFEWKYKIKILET